MCQQIIQFCSSSTKPLLYAGSFLLLLIALAVGYTGCTAHALYQDIDPSVAEQKSISYYLQLVGAAYLALLTVLAIISAYYDQKQSIRVLSVVTSINFVLAIAALLMVPSVTDLGSLFTDRLTAARGLYNFTDKFIVPNSTTLVSLNQTETLPLPVATSTRSSSRETPSPDASLSGSKQLTHAEATSMWDALQGRGCCGIANYTEWGSVEFPKSCCNNPVELAGNDTNNKFICKTPDLAHNKPCLEVIGSTSTNLLIVLAMIALVNLFLATVTGVSTYRTFHYSEASQNAYN